MSDASSTSRCAASSRGHALDLGAEAVGVGAGRVGQQCLQLTRDPGHGLVFGAQPIDRATQVRVVLRERGQHHRVLAGVAIRF